MDDRREFWEQFDARRYGAKGDGVTDNTAAFQAAEDAAAAAHGLITGPPDDDWLYYDDVAALSGLSGNRVRKLAQISRNRVKAGKDLLPWHLPLPAEARVRRELVANGRNTVAWSPRWTRAQITGWLPNRRTATGRPPGSPNLRPRPEVRQRVSQNTR